MKMEQYFEDIERKKYGRRCLDPTKLIHILQHDKKYSHEFKTVAFSKKDLH